MKLISSIKLFIKKSLEKNMSKNKLKKIFIAIISIFLCLSIVFISLTVFHINRNVDIHYHPKNVILLIGDGMGENHIEITKEALKKDQMNIELFPIQGKVTTFSKNFINTDSAAAASAMATGKKTLNHMVAQEANSTINESLTEIAIRHNMKTGIISSSNLFDATPAAFSSHTYSRENYEDIIEQQISSSIDILIGEGKEEYDKYKQDIIKNKIYSDNLQDLPENTNEEILCALTDISANKNGENVLLSCTKYTLKELSNNENGFFLMIEGAKIDEESHQNNVEGMIKELMAFDEVVGYCLDFAKNSGDTCVIVTADHETGKIALPNGRGINNDLFQSTSHTNRLVGYYLYPDNIAIVPSVIDNTYIYRLIYGVISS